MKNRKNIHILDFAYGTGYISEFVLSILKDATKKITAIDISDKIIGIARGKISESRCLFI